ncbi:MAG TPA: lipopolysaccharide heptosyltransferase II [Sedimentisphaerales bacterium]|jgi:heptosyltransferase-2|nr:lipopolysaccharide heptosyltransferase II [Sedimentisphaerales bacterium]HNU29620.1 lipopolysaccharide heptosyltransferase II [Sedimentisphaerales bacterium]
MTSKLADVRTLAVRCPNWVGDVVMATPVFDCLRRSLPQARIIGVMKRSAQGIVRDGPWFDDFVDGNDKTWSGFQQMRRQIRGLAPDAAILLTNSIRSVLTMRLSGVRRVYGYRREWRSPLLTGGPTSGKPPIPMGEYYMEICRWLGLELPSRPKPSLFIGEGLARRANALLGKYSVAESDFLIGLNPGASFGSSKCWPPEYFAELAGRLRKAFDAKVILFSGPGEEGIIQAILDRTEVDLIDTRADRVDLEMLKPLVKRCNLFITNDTGPRHYAVAFDVPTVVLMGSTDPRYTAANLDHSVVLRKELACSPCHKKVCPRGHECMREIRPAEVFAAAEQLVNAYGQHGPGNLSKKMA